MTPPTSTSSRSDRGAVEAAARATFARLVETWGRPDLENPGPEDDVYERLDSFAVVELTPRDGIRDRADGRPLRATRQREHPRQHEVAAPPLPGLDRLRRRDGRAWADLRFSRATLAGLVTTVGACVQAFDDEAAALGLAPRRRSASSGPWASRPGTSSPIRHHDGGSLPALGAPPPARPRPAARRRRRLILVTQTPDLQLAVDVDRDAAPPRHADRHALLRHPPRLQRLRLWIVGSPTVWSNPASTASSSASATVASRMVATGDRSITRSWVMPAPRC